LVSLIFFGAVSITHQNSLLHSDSPVKARSVSPSTAVVSVVPQNVSDLSKVKGSVIVFNVTLAFSPSISAFDIWVQFDPNVLSASSSSIDYSGNILGSSAQVQSECINDQAIQGSCGSLDGLGVVNLGLAIFGGATTSVSGGLLYRISLTVVSAGFSQIHLLEVILANGVTNLKYDSDSGTVITQDGFFVNEVCGSAFCRAPSVFFTISPVQPSIGSTVTFNASASKATNPSAKIVQYTWFWDEICRAVATTQSVTDPVITHVFCNKQIYHVTLTVQDSVGIRYSLTKPVNVTYVFIDVTYGGVTVDHQFGVYPGTVVHVTAQVQNNSTAPINATITVSLDTGQLLGNQSFSLSQRGGATGTIGTLGPVPWNTTNLPARVYRIIVTVGSNVPQNVTNDKSTSTFVQLIVQPPGGNLSLGLFQTTGLGIIVIIALAAGLARFRRKPRWEDEPL
jgi:hypothetical protein